jgi:hypothetical protein
MQTHEKLMALFSGLDRAYGTYLVNGTTKYAGKKLIGPRETISAPVTADLWKKHLEGEKRIGIVPIKDDGTVLFSALDIDVYGKEDEHPVFIKKMKELGVPLVPCRSKSGALHLYLFLKQPLPADIVVSWMREISILLGYGECEIFPKQVALLTSRGDVGNWINMPYFGGDQGTVKAVKEDGSFMSVEEFLAHSEEMKQGSLISIDAQEAEIADLPEAPPCLLALARNKVSEGSRNDCLFAFGVYAKRAFPDDVLGTLERVNEKYFEEPLEEREVSSVSHFVNTKDYLYPCKKPHLKKFCNSKVCKTKKYGIQAAEKAFTLKNLSKYDSTPPIWFIDVENVGRLELTTEELYSQINFQKKCMDTLNFIPPPVKGPEWHETVNALLKSVDIIHAPEEASPSGQLMAHLEKFCTGRAQARSKEELLLPDKPWHSDGKHHFKLSDLMAFLERNGFKDMKANKVAALISDRGGNTHKYTIQGKIVNIWTFPEFLSPVTEVPSPSFPENEIF